jgi:hypothetical protein
MEQNVVKAKRSVKQNKSNKSKTKTIAASEGLIMPSGKVADVVPFQYQNALIPKQLQKSNNNKALADNRAKNNRIAKIYKALETGHFKILTANETMEYFNLKHPQLMSNYLRNNNIVNIALKSGQPEINCISEYDLMTKYKGILYTKTHKGLEDAASYYLEDVQRNRLAGIKFKPECPIIFREGDETFYNSFMGLTCKSKEGDCSAYLSLIRDVICSGDPQQFEYVINWLAWMLQRPNELPDTQLIIRGSESAETFVGLLSDLYGVHALTMTNDIFRQGVSTSMERVILLILNEAGTPFNPYQEAAIKSLVKNKKLNSKLWNYVHVIRYGPNIEVKIDKNDVSHFCLESSSPKGEANYNYRTNEIEAFYYFLKNVNLEGWNAKKCFFKTNMWKKQVINNLNPVCHWVSSKLRIGVLLPEDWSASKILRDINSEFAERTITAKKLANELVACGWNSKISSGHMFWFPINALQLAIDHLEAYCGDVFDWPNKEKLYWKNSKEETSDVWYRGSKEEIIDRQHDKAFNHMFGDIMRITIETFKQSKSVDYARINKMRDYLTNQFYCMPSSQLSTIHVSLYNSSEETREKELKKWHDKALLNVPNILKDEMLIEGCEDSGVHPEGCVSE